MQPEALLTRLDEIGQSLAASGHGLALLGLGSVGLETTRLDAYSDLDFFAIVEPGWKQAYIETLDWLEAVHPAAYAFRNTPDGYKLLFADGIFCEFAVFEADELAGIPFAPGRIVWKRADAPAEIAIPVQRGTPPALPDREWLLGEALTNLYVGLGRFLRGEKLSAARFVQQYAVDKALALAALVESEQPGERDLYSPERRFEQRFPATSAWLPGFVQGYEKTPESARAILDFLSRHFSVHPAMRAAIEKLLDSSPPDGAGPTSTRLFEPPAPAAVESAAALPLTPQPPEAVQLARRFWELMNGSDFYAVGALLSDDFTLDWPQSLERIRGRENFARLNTEYPANGRWRFTLNHLVGDALQAASDVSVTDGVVKARAISFFTVQQGKIVRMVEFWPEPYPAPENRRGLVESLKPPER